MSKTKTSCEYTLWGDLDGISVANLRRMLDAYPDDARVSVRTDKVYGRGGWTDQDRDFFVFTWDE